MSGREENKRLCSDCAPMHLSDKAITGGASFQQGQQTTTQQEKKIKKKPRKIVYISKNKFYLSKIESGLFKRSYFNKSLLRNSVYDSSDKDFNNVSKIKGLLIQESIFSNSNNVLSSATYLNSFLINL